MRTKANSALNGMRGVHLVAAEIALHGFAPVVTMRNTPFADVLAQPVTFEGDPLSISVKYNAGGSTFFLLGKTLPPKSHKAFYVLVLESKGRPCKMWVVPTDVLRESPRTKGRAKGRQILPGHLGLHESAWGYEVYYKYLSRFEGEAGWEGFKQASMKQDLF